MLFHSVPNTENIGIVALNEIETDIPPQFGEPIRFDLADVQEGADPSKIAAIFPKLKIILLFVADDSDISITNAVSAGLQARGVFVVTFARDNATAAAADATIVNLNNREHSLGLLHRGVVAPFCQADHVDVGYLKKFLGANKLSWLSSGAATTSIDAMKEALSHLGETIHRASAISVAFSAAGGGANLRATKKAAQQLQAAQLSPKCSLSYSWHEVPPSGAVNEFFVSVLCQSEAA